MYFLFIMYENIMKMIDYYQVGLDKENKLLEKILVRKSNFTKNK